MPREREEARQEIGVDTVKNLARLIREDTAFAALFNSKDKATLDALAKAFVVAAKQRLI